MINYMIRAQLCYVS